MNTPGPNAKDNTIVVECFQAKDSYSNLKSGYERIRGQIEALQNSSWREIKIRLTLFGDCQFLSMMYGISGSAGNYPWLWCHVKRSEIQSEDTSLNCDLRTLETLHSDHSAFQIHGTGKKTHASQFNNVINPALIRIDLYHVCPPYLHIMLGIVKKHHDLLEKDVLDIDRDIGNLF